MQNNKTSGIDFKRFLHDNGRMFFICLCFGLFIIACFVHCWQLAAIPAGFYIDEAAIANSSWSVLHTGADEYGTRLPMFFRCFDNYHDPVMVYFLVPLMAVFGKGIAVVRFPGGFFHIAAGIAFACLVWRMFRNKYLAAFSGFIFAVLPWAFPLSRNTSAGYMPMLLGICFGWLFMIPAFNRKSCPAAILSALGWAFAMYSHNCGRLTVALYLIAFGLAFNFLILKRWKVFVMFSVSLIAFMLPMILVVLRRGAALTQRFSTISVWHDSPGTREVVNRIVVRYLDYFNPYFVFITGDSNPRHNSGVGLLFLFMLPLVIIGLYVLVKYFLRNPWYRFIIAALLVYPAAAILTVDRFHSTRSLNGAPFWCMTAVAGALWCWRRREKLKLLLVALAIFAAGEVSYYFYDYFTAYPKSVRGANDAAMLDSLQAAVKLRKNSETVWICPSAMPMRVNHNFKPYYYSHLVYFGNIPPKQYRKSGIPPEKFRLYGARDKITAPAWLLRRSMVRIFNNGRLEWIYNGRPLPKGAELKLKIPADGPGEYQIYRIKE